jgi:hypothetical protein
LIPHGRRRRYRHGSRGVDDADVGPQRNLDHRTQGPRRVISSSNDITDHKGPIDDLQRFGSFEPRLVVIEPLDPRRPLGHRSTLFLLVVVVVVVVVAPQHAGSLQNPS